MCGIAGYVASEQATKTKAREIFKVSTALMLAAQERGTHATGYVAAQRKGEWSLDGKAAGPATEFVKKEKWYTLRRHMPHFVVGHTRHTTNTTPKVMANNHPFFGNRQPWALVHNGWLTNDDAEREALIKGGVQFDSLTDSEVILRLAEEADNPVDGAVNTLATLTGPQAVALLDYPDQSPARLYLWTNGGNPLCTARLSQIPGVIFYGSTERIIETAVSLALGKRALRGLTVEKIKTGRILRVRSLRKSVKIEECARMEPEDIAHNPIKRKVWTSTARGKYGGYYVNGRYVRHDDAEEWDGVRGITDYFAKQKEAETGTRGVIVIPAQTTDSDCETGEAFTRGATEEAWERYGRQIDFEDDMPIARADASEEEEGDVPVRKVAEKTTGKKLRRQKRQRRKGGAK